MRAASLPLAAAVLLCACGSDPAPSGEQNREMDAASDLLDQAPERLSRVDDQGLEAAQEQAGEAEGGPGRP